MMGKTPCCNAELGLKKGTWTSDEDRKLIAYIKEHGEGGWRTLPEKAGLQRCGKSCRLRWTNYLRPDIKRGEFTAEEDEKIFQLHASLGNRWSAIARHLPKRTDNEIKNYWNTHLKKRLLDMGVDPVIPNQPDTSSSAPSANPPPPPPSVSSPPSSVSSSAHLLNKLASKISPSSMSHCSIIKDLSLRASSSSSSSASARLLNKMASRVSSPLHSLSTLKTILSRAVDADNDNGNYLQPSTSASSLSESTVSDESRCVSDSTGILNNDQTATYSDSNNLLPFNHFDNLDLLKDWPEINSDGVVSSGMESPHESSELENLLQTYIDEVNNDVMISSLTANYHEQDDDMAMDLDGLTNNNYVVHDAPPNIMSASTADSCNAAESEGGEIFYDPTYDDFSFEFCNFSIMSDSDHMF